MREFPPCHRGQNIECQNKSAISKVCESKCKHIVKVSTIVKTFIDFYFKQNKINFIVYLQGHNIPIEKWKCIDLFFYSFFFSFF